MKKIFLASSIFYAAVAAAENPNNLVDYAQPRPNSTVKENVVLERQVTQSVMINGQVVEQNTQNSVEPSSSTIEIESPAKSLMPAQVYDNTKDLEATMKLMGRNFKAIRGAQQLSEMAQPAAELSRWASQAEALSIEGGAEDKEKYLQGMQHVRHLVADLEVAIEQNDDLTARTIINELGDTRKEYHRYFDVN